jgi:hypothetical protein
MKDASRSVAVITESHTRAGSVSKHSVKRSQCGEKSQSIQCREASVVKSVVKSLKAFSEESQCGESVVKSLKAFSKKKPVW